MFDHFIWEVVVCPAAIAVTARYLADRMRPQAALTFLVAAIAAAAAACLVTLIAFALKAAAELPVTGELFHFSDRYVRADTAQVPWVSWLSVAMLALAAAGLVRAWARHRRDVRFARRYTDLPVTDGLVLLDDDRAEAFAVPGGDGRIVVTTGMRAALDDTQYAALLAHERAHLTGRHHRLVLIARLSAAVHPAFRRLTRRIDYLVERAADERAATELDDRRAVAHAIGAAALVSVGATGLRMAPSASDLRRAGAVPRRVASLLTPLRTWSPLPLVVPVAVAVFSLAWTAECVWDLGELLAAAHP
ncbi:M56 family metallopeptidase [Actinoplanes aureus]|uniref:M56 family metallopeptidase n=1 Tax=Actinoplanes aureus TaxID=2792083 RepID=A0A931CJK4_9ACTN|nr:M56 family metallopeptidase [Actinoplanes aureus]MBG0568837.1 M56 family metallopeptidase [Actinoplanes aureus]